MAELLAADSHDVWIAFFACVSVGFGCLNIWLQQRNKNVTEKTTKQLREELAVNTAITKDSAAKAEETHRFVKEMQS